MKSIQQLPSSAHAMIHPQTGMVMQPDSYLDKRSTFLESMRKSSPRPVPYDKSVVVKVPLVRDSSASRQH